MGELTPMPDADAGAAAVKLISYTKIKSDQNILREAVLK